VDCGIHRVFLLDVNRVSVGSVYVGSDHAGFELKMHAISTLRELGADVVDVGPFEYDKEDDYPEYAKRVCERISGTANRGILICGTGQGMERAANKFPGVYASVCWDEFTAEVAKEHGDINVLCMGGRTTSPEVADRIIGIWLNSPFSGDERHRRRVKEIKEIEKEHMK
jgi:ribose 5-phosphate isomerase B